MSVRRIQNSNNNISQNIENIHFAKPNSGWKKALLIFGGCMATTFTVDKIISYHMQRTGNPLLQLLAMCGLIAGMGSIISSMFLVRSLCPDNSYDDAIAMKHGKSIFTNNDINNISEPQNMIAKKKASLTDTEDYNRKETEPKPLEPQAKDSDEEYIQKSLYRPLGLELTKN